MWSRRELLVAAGATLAAGPARAMPAPSDRKLLLVFLTGGWDTTFAVDPKLGVDTIEGPIGGVTGEPDDVEEVADFGDLRIGFNPARRPSVLRFFENHAAESLVVGGGWIGGIAHYPNRVRVLTGHPDDDRPDMVHMVASGADPSLPFGAVDLTEEALPGHLGAHGVRLGKSWQLRRLVSAGHSWEGTGLQFDRDADRLVEDYLARSNGRLSDGWSDDFDVALDRMGRVRDRGPELAGLIQAHGDMKPFEGPMQLGRSLLRDGWCRSVLAGTTEEWDTHGDNDTQHDLHERVFQALDDLVNGLKADGELDSTLVMVLSEMTRTPLHTRNGGKDHWPVQTTLLIGGGVRGGRMIGGTSDALQPVPIDIGSGTLDPAGEVWAPANLNAGLLAHFDIDPGDYIHGVTPLGGLT